MDDVDRILSGIERGDPRAPEQLLPLVYEELRRLARQRLDREKPGQTLEATALVHEAYLRLVGDGSDDERQTWQGRGHFFAAAAEAMRRILVERARRKRGPKAGGRMQRVETELDRLTGELGLDRLDLLALDEALGHLAGDSPVRAELVKLRFFVGLSVAEAAEVLGLSVATAERYWTYARARLFSELGGPLEKSAPE